VTPSVIEPATFQLVAQYLNQQQCGFFQNIPNPVAEVQHLNFHALNPRLVRLHFLDDRQ
jgi:hypothetical protein